MEQAFDTVEQETTQAELMLLAMDAGDEDLTLDDPAILAELVIEEVSIDGMCGVY